MTNEQLVERLIKLAEVSGNTHDISNALEHKDVLEHGEAYERDATIYAIKSICMRLADIPFTVD